MIKFLNVDLRKLQGVLLGWLLLLWRLLSTHWHTHGLLLWRHHWCLSGGHLLVHSLSHHSHGLLVLTISLLLLWATSVSTILVVVSTSVVLAASSTSTLESSASLAASHVHLSVVHLTLVLVVEWLLSTHWHTALSVSLTLFALRLDKVDELGNIVSLFLISCLFQIILGLPEIDLKRLLVVAEAS